MQTFLVLDSGLERSQVHAHTLAGAVELVYLALDPNRNGAEVELSPNNQVALLKLDDGRGAVIWVLEVYNQRARESAQRYAERVRRVARDR